MWALNVHRFWQAPNTCMYRCCTPANTSGDQQVVHTNRQVAPSASHKSVVRRGGRRVTCRDHAISKDVKSQRARSNMEGGQVGEVPTIFHPRRSNVILSEDQQRSSLLSPVQIVVELIEATGCEQQQGCVTDGCGDSASSCRTLETTGSAVGSGGAGGGGGGSGSGSVQTQPTGQSQASTHVTPSPTPVAQQPQQPQQPSSLSACYASCCAESAKKIYFGVCVTICVTASWVGATHCIKYLYFHKPDAVSQSSTSNASVNGLHHQHIIPPYNAPFFTTWFCTNWEVLYFPVYFICRATRTKCATPSEIIAESLRGFRDKGFTGGRFLIRCSLFCGLWVITNYMYIHSLRILLATDVMALFATNVSCVYLLSWVILHEQFVGVRIVAVILCNTGIALLAYMDGITGSPTLGGVVLATSAAAGSAVYKVLFKKVIGETTFGQMSLFFSLIGLCNAALLWPICLALYFSGAETMHWARLPWATLLSASILHLVANMLGNFSIALTYDLFITLGLITAVPVSAALDVVLYGAHFVGMKLAGMIFIAVGFFLVMFPDNWPDYITRLLRTSESQQGRRNVVRSRTASLQQRQYRLRSYGVSAAHGDGQTLLPISNSNSSNSQQPIAGSGGGAANRQLNSSQQQQQQQYSSTSETQPRCVLPSTSTSTSTSTSATVVGNSHRCAMSSYSHLDPRNHQGGAGDTGTACQVDRRAT
ncbi:solute carrier family 35 member F4 isoform X3 [Odontomachus brunneus]|uniref:solute carrier family 35 member F4 isoform X3 n=1 Tax=Odontomachus brunneus TaxID=486640 RepID=UPI0013F182F3|nr:solute carrier family 35 member F4 isoform X3 [Odontomachus brunneus]